MNLMRQKPRKSSRHAALGRNLRWPFTRNHYARGEMKGKQWNHPQSACVSDGIGRRRIGSPAATRFLDGRCQ
jgi:hypothetical protein